MASKPFRFDVIICRRSCDSGARDRLFLQMIGFKSNCLGAAVCKPASESRTTTSPFSNSVTVPTDGQNKTSFTTEHTERDPKRSVQDRFLFRGYIARLITSRSLVHRLTRRERADKYRMKTTPACGRQVSYKLVENKVVSIAAARKRALVLLVCGLHAHAWSLTLLPASGLKAEL